MADIKVSKNIIPVSEFKAHAAKWLRHVNETGEPLVLTQNGRAAGVLVAPESYDAFDDALSADESAAIQRGLADAAAGRLVPHADAMAHLRSMAEMDNR